MTTLACCKQVTETLADAIATGIKRLTHSHGMECRQCYCIHEIQVEFVKSHATSDSQKEALRHWLTLELLPMITAASCHQDLTVLATAGITWPTLPITTTHWDIEINCINQTQNCGTIGISAHITGACLHESGRA